MKGLLSLINSSCKVTVSTLRAIGNNAFCQKDFIQFIPGSRIVPPFTKKCSQSQCIKLAFTVNCTRRIKGCQATIQVSLPLDTTEDLKELSCMWSLKYEEVNSSEVCTSLGCLFSPTNLVKTWQHTWRVFHIYPVQPVTYLCLPKENHGHPHFN